MKQTWKWIPSLCFSLIVSVFFFRFFTFVRLLIHSFIRCTFSQHRLSSTFFSERKSILQIILNHATHKSSSSSSSSDFCHDSKRSFLFFAFLVTKSGMVYCRCGWRWGKTELELQNNLPLADFLLTKCMHKWTLAFLSRHRSYRFIRRQQHRQMS